MTVKLVLFYIGYFQQHYENQKKNFSYKKKFRYRLFLVNRFGIELSTSIFEIRSLKKSRIMPTTKKLVSAGLGSIPGVGTKIKYQKST